MNTIECQKKGRVLIIDDQPENIPIRNVFLWKTGSIKIKEEYQHVVH